MSLRLAFTLDDGPSVAEEGVPFDPSRMDRCREVLQRHGIPHCVAFVIGSRCADKAALERWLQAGFELGNHTHDHKRASDLSVAQFVESLTRCDELLNEVGAFEGDRPRWFRFPCLDRGRGSASSSAPCRVRCVLAIS